MPPDGPPDPPYDFLGEGPFATEAFEVELDVRRVNAALGLREVVDGERVPAPDVARTWIALPAVGEPGGEGGPVGATADGLLPLIVMAHGNGYRSDWYQSFSARLAAWGAVVVIPQYINGAGACAVTFGRAAYARAAMEWALAAGSDADSPLFGRVDPARIVLAGHSWGGAAAEVEMPDHPARLFVIIDPISPLLNVNEWRNCGAFTAQPRPVSHPLLLLDARASGFRFLGTEYRGLHPFSPRTLVSFGGATHEDVLDVGVHISTDPVRSPLLQQGAATWMMRAMARVLDDDLRFERLLRGFGADRVDPPGGPDWTVLSRRPSLGVRVITDAADSPGAPLVERNRLGGARAARAESVALGRSFPIVALLGPDPDPLLFGAIGELLADRGFAEIHLGQAAGAPIEWTEALGTAEAPLDVRPYALLAVELAADVDGPLEGAITLEDAAGARVSRPLSAGLAADRFDRQVAVGVFLPLAAFDGLDRGAITTVTLRLEGAPHERVVALDDLRLIP